MTYRIRVVAAALALCLVLTACAAPHSVSSDELRARADSTKNYLSIIDYEPDTVDPQCTSEYYTIALNVFDRLVEVRTNDNGGSRIVPSLAESWTVDEDGYVYSFHLREGVRFSNGAELTASDVGYTLSRIMTYPASCHKDLFSCIFGAEALLNGSATKLAGFVAHGDYDFSIILSYPCASFLARLSTPAASILDEGTTFSAGGLFGTVAEQTVGTGPFIFTRWVHDSELLLTANPYCWAGAPLCDGIDIKIAPDSDVQSVLFSNGSLDVLDLDSMGSESEYFIRGDIYQDRLYCCPRVGISYVVLNENVEPLSDVRVRKALQLALDRQLLLTAVLGGRGALENGIFPHGLVGYNPELPEIPYDPQEAVRLLSEAGYGNGFDLTISLPDNSSQTKIEISELIAYMWQQIGINAQLEVLDTDNFTARRKSGILACYYGRWSADYNDPENFIDTFFGSEENTQSRCLCYHDESVMARIQAAHGILGETERIREYRELERKIVQEDAAWIPLFSGSHYYVVSERVEGFQPPWNGWSNNRYNNVSVIG
ncbi:MAG: ABC transporter substrate-binding protein [Oscillospiraceae bacterium]|nr:ABC transporter substrate-binding protein [Oscillospiraceae bacterium]